MFVYTLMTSGSNVNNTLTKCSNSYCEKGDNETPKIFKIKDGVAPEVNADSGILDENGNTIFKKVWIPFCSIHCFLYVLMPEGEC